MIKSNTNINFMGKARLALLVSGILLAVGRASLL